MTSRAAVRTRTRPISAVVRPPGSKSFTNRALVAASLAHGVSRLPNPLEADDTEAMRDGLRSLGVQIDDNDDPWLVRGTRGALQSGSVAARQSGTTARFLTAIAPLASGRVEITGEGRLPQRPFIELAEALRSVGIEVSLSDGGLPLVVNGSGRFPSGNIRIDPSRSSQFVTALLLAAPMAEGRVEIELTAAPVSAAYLDSTLEVMRAFSAEVVAEGRRFLVHPTGYVATTYEIEADASAAVYPLVGAAVTGGVVGIEGIPETSSQPDLALLAVLEAMGCRIRRSEHRVDLTGPDELQPVDVDMENAPDSALALAVACLFAAGTSRIRRLSTLRLKESNRLEALVSEIARVGGEAWINDDDLVVVGAGELHPAVIDPQGDHRIAMAMALVGLRQRGIEIDDAEVVNKTWPGYFSMLERL